MRKSLRNVWLVLSITYSTLLCLGLALPALNSFKIWDQLTRTEKIWAVFVFFYPIILLGSGIIYAKTVQRKAGIAHSGLMLGIAGMVAFAIGRGWVSGPGSDNAAGGIVAAANVLFVFGGCLAGVIGAGILSSTNDSQQSENRDLNR